MAFCKNKFHVNLVFVLLLGLLTAGWMATEVKAQTLSTTFELDGNALSQPIPGNDWDSLYFIKQAGIPLHTFNPALDVYTGVIPDPGVTDTTRFGTGSKDILDIPDWGWQDLPPNDKVDLTNGQAALYSPAFLYLEADRFSNDGDAFMGFWLLQDSTFALNPGGTFTGHHFVGTPGSAPGPTGDILILANFTKGGDVHSIAVFEWVDSLGHLGDASDPHFDSLPVDANTAFGIMNTDTTHAPWPYIPKGNNGVPGTFPILTFFEGGLDLGALFVNNVPCFAKVLMETRESQSLTASTKDFLLGEFKTFPEVSITPDTICVGATAELCATIVPGTGVGPFTYLWSTGAITPCISVSPATTTTYTVVVTGANGCSSGPVNGTVVVNQIPVLTCSGPTSVCPGSTQTFSSTFTGPCNNAAHHWTVTGGTIIGSSTGSSISVQFPNACGTAVVKDSLGCSPCAAAPCSTMVKVEDNTPPVLSGCPSDANFQCITQVPGAATVTATDNCAGAITPVFTETQSNPGSSCNNVITRTWTATDACGNVASCTQKITVNDNTPPTITCPGPVSVECIGDVPAPNTGLVTATDNCGTPTVTFVGDVPSGTCPKIITRTYKATDACGNSATCTQTITVNDNIPPLITCPGPVTVECIGDVPAPDISLVTATDNCGTVTKAFVSDVPAGTCPIVITRTYKATDGCGNESFCTQLITVNDNIPPVITCPGPVTVECIGDVPAPDISLVTATDNCGTPTKAFVSDVPAGTCPTIITRTYKATDACGNVSTCTQTITVDDNTAPVITCPGPVTVECIGDVPAPDISLVTATDNCGTPTKAFVSDVPSGNCPKVITRTYKATDACGNESFCTQLITVNDNIPPVITCPGPVTVQCDGDVPAPNTALVTATDNCGTPTVTFVGDVPVGACPKVITRTYKATDECGNFSTCSQTITVNDITPPVLSGCPKDTSVQCITQVPAAATVTANDNCDGAISPVFSETQSNNGSSCNNTITRTWTATDKCGNKASCTQLIIVNDTTNPVITCAPNKTVLCGQTVVFDTVSATDNCDSKPIVSVLSVISAPNASGGTDFTKTWVVTDACGNADTCNQTITQSTCGQITPTQTTCNDFISGTAGNLTQVCFGLKSGKINNVAPGVFFYYTKFTATQTNFTVNIVQTNNNAAFPFFDVQQLNQVFLYDANCNKIGSFTTTDGQVAVPITGAAVGQVFIIGVKYSTGSVVGTHATPNTVVHYDFKTVINNVIVDADPDGLDLKNCVGTVTTAGIPAELTLSANYPNPFNPTTEIRFALPQATEVRLEVYNVLGQKVATLAEGPFEAGEHAVTWNANDQASGIYFYRLTTPDGILTKKMLLMK